MYQPRHFAEEDPAQLQALMRSHPLATLVHTDADGLTADHVPLQYDAARGLLLGHVARANPLWRKAAADEGIQVLAIFRAEQAYVSPNWYPSKAQTHKAVPTWNYAVVHAHGRLRAKDDAAWLHGFLSGLTAQHEATQPKPWTLDEAPADYMAQMMKAIVGIEITVERLTGKFKLSQNRPEADRLGVIQGMSSATEASSQGMAQRLREREAGS